MLSYFILTNKTLNENKITIEIKHHLYASDVDVESWVKLDPFPVTLSLHRKSFSEGTF